MFELSDTIKEYIGFFVWSLFFVIGLLGLMAGATLHILICINLGHPGLCSTRLMYFGTFIPTVCLLWIIFMGAYWHKPKCK